VCKINEKAGTMSKNKQPISKAFNVQHVFFVPVWRRILVVAGSALWAIFEFVNGAPFWALLFGAVAIYCAHQFFIAFDPVDKEK